jgi:hypothetical protein
VGNAYCGGFVVGYVESGGDPVVAGKYGTVSATFTLEQRGIPRLDPTNNPNLAKIRLVGL